MGGSLTRPGELNHCTIDSVEKQSRKTAGQLQRMSRPSTTTLDVNRRACHLRCSWTDHQCTCKMAQSPWPRSSRQMSFVTLEAFLVSLLSISCNVGTFQETDRKALVKRILHTDQRSLLPVNRSLHENEQCAFIGLVHH